ncbi:MAG: CRTAC1 family protein [Halobacteria archaeon]
MPAVLLSSCTSGPQRPSVPPTAEDANRAAVFHPASDSGISFRKANLPGIANSAYGAFGGGVAVGDYNSDGKLDLYFVQGGPNRLFRNDGNWRFADVTAAAGVGDSGEGRAAAFGDYDNNGCPDLYVANLFSSNRLYRNNCDGTFTDVTTTARVGYSGTTHHVAWGDYDRDGLLDLYLVNYADFLGTSADPYSTFGGGGRRLATEADPSAAPGPQPFSFAMRDGPPNVLYRNNGDGTFTDVTKAAGVGDTGWGFAAIFSDLDGDAWPDLYVANDFGSNTLYFNLGNGRFREVTNESGTGYRGNGMGVDSGDYDNDGDLDLYVTNIVWQDLLAQRLGVSGRTREEQRANLLEKIRDPRSEDILGYSLPVVREVMLDEGSALYRNSGNGPTFTEVARSAGVHRVEWGWGAVFMDYDNDADLDIYAANGFSPGNGDAYMSPLNRLFRNQGHGASFEEVAAREGVADPGESRGIAYGDFDGDGDLDLVVVNHAGPVGLYRNDIGNRNHWSVVKLVGACGPSHRGSSSPAGCSNRDGIGAWVKVKVGNLSLLREVKSGSGYASNSMVPVHFGLGPREKIDTLEIQWPSGKVTRMENVPADRWMEVREP